MSRVVTPKAGSGRQLTLTSFFKSPAQNGVSPKPTPKTPSAMESNKVRVISMLFFDHF